MKTQHIIVGIGTALSAMILIHGASIKVSAVSATAAVFAGGVAFGAVNGVKTQKDKAPKIQLSDAAKDLGIARLAREIADTDGDYSLLHMTVSDILTSEDARVQRYVSIAKSIFA